ncbi:MAG TPA: right-handed parallel beta-helix repeat-containing protein, partial [Dehalococcoidia bacterium]|nr:right-handed parallel beta-helix repeat-containing protein [Dehalococcoidia bacterium]
AGSTVTGFIVEHATLEGILAQNTSGLSIHNNVVKNNDLGVNAATPTGECAAQGATPGDCGEALHLWSVTNSTVKQNMVSDNDGGILLTDETGPTSGNTITENKVTSTGADCGIVLASHAFNLGAPVDPSMGGVFNNTITNNSVVDSGPNGAGVGLFAAAPGGSTYNNTVSGNTLSGNGLPGVAIHSHSPFQNVNGNVITNNVISNNGADDDAETGGPTGIVVFADVASGAMPIKTETISGNRISNEAIGIFIKGAAATIDVSTNAIEVNVATPVSVVSTGSAPSGNGTSGSSGAATGSGTSGSIQPPNTGDAGLASTASGAYGLEVLAILSGLLALAFLGAVRVRQS